MTVCVAAICTVPNDGQVIIGASDQMRTAGDVQFEPPQPKLYIVSAGHTVILTAGDSAIQQSLSASTYYETLNRKVSDVCEIAEIYAAHFAAYRRKQK